MPKLINKEKTLQALEDYIRTTDIPIVAEFAYLHNMSCKYLNENNCYADPIERLLTKKQANLERRCLEGQIDKTMAIFSLKQLGWTDNVKHDISVEYKYKDITDEDLIKKARERGLNLPERIARYSGLQGKN